MDHEWNERMRRVPGLALPYDFGAAWITSGWNVLMYEVDRTGFVLDPSSRGDITSDSLVVLAAVLFRPSDVPTSQKQDPLFMDLPIRGREARSGHVF